jgi:hypothetical protein
MGLYFKSGKDTWMSSNPKGLKCFSNFTENIHNETKVDKNNL